MKFPETFEFFKHDCPFCKGHNATSHIPKRGGANILRCPKCHKAYFLTWLGPWNGEGGEREQQEMEFARSTMEERKHAKNN